MKHSILRFRAAVFSLSLRVKTPPLFTRFERKTPLQGIYRVRLQFVTRLMLPFFLRVVDRYRSRRFRRSRRSLIRQNKDNCDTDSPQPKIERLPSFPPSLPPPSVEDFIGLIPYSRAKPGACPRFLPSGGDITIHQYACDRSSGGLAR